MKFDTDKAGSETNYTIDHSSNDSLLFNNQYGGIVGFFPDTTNYYDMLYYYPGDKLLPSILTFNKSGEIVDVQVISTGACIANPRINIISCYDSVWINSDHSFKSLSKLNSTIYLQANETCNVLKLSGSIRKSGRIKIESKDVVECDS